MKIVSWNVRGVGSLRKRGVIKDYLNKINPNGVTRNKKRGDG